MRLQTLVLLVRAFHAFKREISNESGYDPNILAVAQNGYVSMPVSDSADHDLHDVVDLQIADVQDAV